jgi:hypothetical protein
MLSKKVFLPGELNFSAPPVHAARRCEGPRRIKRRRPQSFVRVRQTLAEAAAGKHRLSRDLESCSIFDFFDSIGQKPAFPTSFERAENKK